ncbi:DNA sulfur modification protein DndD [Kitasatospora sp. NPDC051853]|uniref:DNA sulfur modification protein DndD n=1 Tax=Kitasatospora sp. NPDC051853 TaxID=3364058 RepID=UPI00378C19E2
MLLHKITLENFGAYRGRHSLELTPKKNQPIVLIGGLNGCGKTTLLDAIQLSLYGRRANCSARGGRNYEMFLRESINRQVEAGEGASVAIEFSIAVEDEERFYTVIRNWGADGKDALTVEINGVAEPVIAGGWLEHVEEILPFDLSSLFFFDGEKIEALADPEQAGAVIRTAVRSLMGVHAVEQLRTDLGALQRRQEMTPKDQELMAVLEAREAEYEAAVGAVDAEVQKRSRLKATLDRLQGELEQSERDFEREGGRLFERMKDLEVDRERVKSQVEASASALVNAAASSLPLLLLQDQLETLSKQAEQESEAFKAIQVVEVLADRDKWLLGLLDGLPDSTRQSVSRKLTADRKKRTSVASWEHGFRLPHDAVAQLAVLRQTLAHDLKRSRELLDESAGLRDELDTLDRQLSSVPDQTRVESIMAKRRELHDGVAVARADHERASAIIDDLKRRRDQLEAAVTRARKEAGDSTWDAEAAKRLFDYAERTRGTLAQFSGALVKRHIGLLEVAVLQSFDELMRKRGLVKNLHIDPESFALKLWDEEGEQLNLGRLSAGERQLLAISLLAGLMKVAGNRLPSVIDTPLGRLDSQHRQHLVDRYFPKAGRQVLLLSTDEEIDEHLLARLKPSISHTYMLVHDDTELTTAVVPGYWWTSGAVHVA